MFEAEAKRIYTLFAGCELGHGTYGKEEKTPGRVKSEIKKSARTLREPASIQHWEQHLAGERALGIIPIKEDGTCNWGVIDVDQYDLSHREIAAKVKSLALPLIVCRSKSGGAHLFVFLSEFIQAGDMMARLRDLAAIMGFGSSEVFPKQTELLIDRGDLGNWLNMPYFKADGGNRYAVNEEGRGLSIKRFLDLAESSRLTVEQFMTLRPKLPESAPDFNDGPPCLQHLSVVGVDEGGRNNALFNFGILAKKMKPDAWEGLLEQWNYKFVNPPLSSEEVSLVLRSLRKKDYVYKCKEPPLCNHCDQMVCRGRRFGIGAAGSMPSIASISRLDSEPALYFVRLESGETVECTHVDIASSKAFQMKVLDQLHRLIPVYKTDVWNTKMAELLDNQTVIEAPYDIKRSGAFLDLLQTFLTDRYAAQTLEEVLLGKPFLDEDRGTYVFRFNDLMTFLATNKFMEYNRNQVSSRLKDIGTYDRFVNLSGKGVNLRYLAKDFFEVQTKSFETPRKKDAPI